MIMSDEKLPPKSAKPPAEPAGQSDRALSPTDVRDVLSITLEKIRESNSKSLAALKESTERLLNESEAARDMVQRLSQPPKPPDEKK